MDNLFEILIYLIIIISFLSSIFRKKTRPKPPAETEQTTDREPVQPMAASSSDTSDDYDIVKEIEKLFKMETEGDIQKPEPAKTLPSQTKRTTIESMKEEGKVSAPSAAAMNRWEAERKRVEERKGKIDSSIEVQAKKFEQLLSKKTVTDRMEIKNIRAKLKQKQSFREFIIVSEILGKPKAFRR